MINLREFWYRVGLVTEARNLLDNLLNLPQDQTSARCLGGGYEVNANLHRISGNFKLACELYEKSLQVFQASGDEKNLVNVHNGLGVCAYLDGAPDVARHNWEQGRVLAERLNDSFGSANLCISLGFLAKDNSDYKRMQELFQRALEIYQSLGHKFGIMTATSNLGFAALHQGNLESSLRFQQEALSAALEMSHDDSIIRCLEDLASLAAIGGQPALCLQLAATTAKHREALGLPIEPHDKVSLEGYLEKARAALDEKDIRQAIEHGQTMTLPEAAQAARKLELTPKTRTRAG
jgi:tetratricopeptide (TPR) repeat protein